MDIYRSVQWPKDLKYHSWQLGAISFTIPYRNQWNVIYDRDNPFPSQFLIRIIEIGHLRKIWWDGGPVSLQASRFFPSCYFSQPASQPAPHIFSQAASSPHFPRRVQSSQTSSNLSGASILPWSSLRIQICYIGHQWTSIEVYNDQKDLKYHSWQLGAISFTIPYRNQWNVIYDGDNPFPSQFLIQIIEI